MGKKQKTSRVLVPVGVAGNFKLRQAGRADRNENPGLASCIPLPGTRLVAIGAGALFGPLQGFSLVYVGALVGATGGFFASRFLFGRRLEPLVVKRFPKLFAETEMNAEVYLWSLRLSPLFSFALVHYAMGLTRIRFTRFLGVTALCSAAYSVLYVSAGGALAQAAVSSQAKGSENAALPLGWLAAFFVLSLLPFAFRKRALKRKESASPAHSNGP